MKIKITTVQEYEYNIEEEISRLNEVFKGSVLKRQLAILDAFIAQDLDKVEHLYHTLPYNEKEGCPEQEFVGLWFSILQGSWPHSKFLKHEKTLVEIVENL